MTLLSIFNDLFYPQPKTGGTMSIRAQLQAERAAIEAQLDAIDQRILQCQTDLGPLFDKSEDELKAIAGQLADHFPWLTVKTEEAVQAVEHVARDL